MAKKVETKLIALPSHLTDAQSNVVKAARGAGLGDKKAATARKEMADALLAKGLDAECDMTRYLLIAGYVASRCEISLERAFRIVQKGQTRTEDEAKAMATGKTYYNRARSDAGIDSNSKNAGNKSAEGNDRGSDETATRPARQPGTPVENLPEYTFPATPSVVAQSQAMSWLLVWAKEGLEFADKRNAKYVPSFARDIVRTAQRQLEKGWAEYQKQKSDMKSQNDKTGK